MGLYDGIDREARWVALFTLLTTKLASAGIVTFSRKHLQPPTLTPEQQPALFLVQARETRRGTPVIGAPVQLILNGFIILYLQGPASLDEVVGQETELAATQLNALLKGIDDSLAPDSVVTGKQTLGGLVTHCWIEGDTEMDDGIYSPQAAAILCVRMLVP